MAAPSQTALESAAAISTPAAAAGQDENSSTDPEIFSFKPLHDPGRPRSLFWMPAMSLLLPGLDQWAEQQYPSAGLYSGMALTGACLGFNDTDWIGMNGQPLDRDASASAKMSLWGFQLYYNAGGLSAYHSFRTAVETHRGQGRFSFLKHEETADELLLAPLNMTYLLRPTTFIPLSLFAGFVFIMNRDSDTRVLQSGDYAYTAGLSFNAGVGEEALYRGWIMPYMMETCGNPYLSNLGQASLFAAYHIPIMRIVPVWQFGMGLYFGWLVQHRGWTLGESIFLHFWWDIIAFGVNFLTDTDRSREINIILPIFAARF
jgi:membrane protease YdiL (CAAX protease family)